MLVMVLILVVLGVIVDLAKYHLKDKRFKINLHFPNISIFFRFYKVYKKKIIVL